MSDNGDNNNNNNRKDGAPANEQELATRQIQIQSKRFYIDVKENDRGRFIKLAEVGVGGRKSRIIMSLSAANEFKVHLNDFSEYHSNMGPTHGSTVANNNNNKNNDNNRDNNEGLLKSATISGERKRYYLDLKENQRGRFLRVSMVIIKGPRAQIAIPAQGLIEFKDHLTELLDQYGTKETSSNLALPESKVLRAENKTFYFDCGSNPRGIFLRLSEVRQYGRFRSSITVPEKYWDQFVKNMNEFIDNVNEERDKTSSVTNEATTTVTPPSSTNDTNKQDDSSQKQ